MFLSYPGCIQSVRVPAEAGEMVQAWHLQLYRPCWWDTSVEEAQASLFQLVSMASVSNGSFPC